MYNIRREMLLGEYRTLVMDIHEQLEDIVDTVLYKQRVDKMEQLLRVIQFALLPFVHATCANCFKTLDLTPDTAFIVEFCEDCR